MIDICNFDLVFSYKIFQQKSSIVKSWHRGAILEGVLGSKDFFFIRVTI